MDNQLKELTELANDLDLRGLTKEADALDSIIKEASAMDRVQQVLNWIRPYSGASNCSRRTAMAMISLTQEERARFSGCTAMNYEFSDDADKADILKALSELKNEGSRHSHNIDPTAQAYLSRLARKGDLPNLMTSDSEFFEGLVTNSPFGDVADSVKDIIMFGVNAGSKAIGKGLDRIDDHISEAEKGTFVSQRGLQSGY